MCSVIATAGHRQFRVPDRERPGPDRHPAAADEDVRKPRGAESNTGVHRDLHNLWTSRWMEACRHVETEGDSAHVVPASPARPAHQPPTACGRKKVGKISRAAHHVSHPLGRRPDVARLWTTSGSAAVDRPVSRPRRLPPDGAPPPGVRRRVRVRQRAAQGPQTPRGAPDRSPTPLVGATAVLGALRRGRPRWSAGR